MLKLKVFLVAAVVPLVVQAACPNSCSGHGSCGEYDSCTCHTNWEGGDCSQRVCMYNWAWATTAQGDLNFDGDVYDATVYPKSHTFKQPGVNFYLTTDAAPGGTWESWPTYHSQSGDEGHFYMECSNKGICDRSTGLCKCFDGFEGQACRRQNCHNNCNGHGKCRSVAELGNALSTPIVYTLWDKDMATICECDPGWQGNSCAERTCPRGDDPLTKDRDQAETQYIEIYSAVSSLTTSPVTATTDFYKELMEGTATFTFTDADGASYTTDPITISHYDGTDTAVAMATNLENALLAFPNNVIPSVSVTASYCEKPVPQDFDSYAAGGTISYAGSIVTTGGYRCPNARVGLATTTESNAHVIVRSDLEVMINGQPTGNYNSVNSPDDAVTVHAVESNCALIAYPECVRFEVKFTGNPGPQNLLSVDTSNMQRGASSTAYDNTHANHANIQSPVTKQLLYVDDAVATFGYQTTESSSSTNPLDFINTATKTVILSNAIASTSYVYPAGATVELFCAGDSLGYFTVATTLYPGAAFNLVVEEAITANNMDCTSGHAGLEVKVTLVSEIVHTNVNLALYDLVGKKIVITGGTWPTSTTNMIVTSVTYDNTGANTATQPNYAGIIFLDTTDTMLSTSVGATTDADLYLDGTGTQENAECGDRGLCDRETGTCRCFKGYSGHACETQNALAA